jgi:hypothetical protein
MRTKRISFRYPLIFFFVSILLVVLNKELILDEIKNHILLRSYVKSTGIAGVDRNINPKHIFSSAFENLSNFLLDSGEDLPKISIDMKFKEYSSLRDNRNNSISNGIQYRNEQSWHKAKIKFLDSKVKAEVRLKGIYLDHIATNKWSLKIKLKDGSLFGARKFYIQAPFTRDFHTSPLIDHAMRQKGVLAPFNGYFDVTLNGNNLGIMYLEEDYSESFTERSLRPYGPIFKIDKSQSMNFVDKKGFWKKDRKLKFIAEKIDAIFEDPNKYMNYFNKDKWAEYLATTFVFKCFHGNLDGNVHLYFHPISQNLEPISSDNSCGQTDPNRSMGFLPKKNEFIYKLLSNEDFRLLLYKKLDWWTGTEAESLKKSIRNLETKYRRLLSSESLFLAKYSVDTSHIEKVKKLIDRSYAGKINSSIEDISSQTKTDLSSTLGQTVSQPPKIFLIRDGDFYDFNISSFDKDKYKLISIQIVIGNRKNEIKINKIANNKNLYKEIKNFLNGLITQESQKETPKLKLRVVNLQNKKKFWVEADLKYKSKEITSRYEKEKVSRYFDYNIEKNEFLIKSKDKRIIDDLIIFPEGAKVKVEEGVNLTFNSGAGMVINGDLEIRGTEDNMVKFSGIDNTDWSGVLILGKGKSVNIDYLIMNGGSGLFQDYQNRGSFTILDANFNLSNSKFLNNHSEDALNIVQSNGLISNILIQNTHSDGLDVDFSDVQISNSNFHHIGSQSGADALDFSKSKIRIKNVHVKNVSDKGVSAGENSRVEIDGLKVEKALVGVASKDGSIVDIHNISLVDIGIADTMAYTKKKGYTEASMKIESLTSDLNIHYAVDINKINLNGVSIAPSDIDIEGLYSNEMRSVKN